MERRKHPRVSVDNLTADLSDGIGFFSGNVADISRLGLCLANIAKKLADKQDKLTVVVSGHGKSFKFKVSKKWEKEELFDKTIGTAIENAPWEWTEFVINSGEPGLDDNWDNES
jgi:hypothetical protein